MKKPWFKGECYIKRREYFRARHMNWRFKSAENRAKLVRSSKAYKKK